MHNTTPRPKVLFQNGIQFIKFGGWRTRQNSIKKASRNTITPTDTD
jgi:hypothetical protein